MWAFECLGPSVSLELETTRGGLIIQCERYRHTNTKILATKKIKKKKTKNIKKYKKHKKIQKKQKIKKKTKLLICICFFAGFLFTVCV